MSLQTKRLDELCTIRSGGTPRRGNAEYYGGSLPWAKIGDLEGDDGVVRTTEENITEAGLAAIRNRVFDPGTILLAMYGSVGKTAVAGTRLSTNQAILGINVKKGQELDERFLLHWLDFMKPRLVTDARGVTQKNISASIVRALKVPLPALEEQRRIAAILDKADAIRRKRREAIALTEELLRSTFLEMFGDPVTNPKGWPTTTLAKLTAGGIRNGLSPSIKGTFPGRVLTLTAITQGAFDPQYQRPAMFDSDLPDSKVVSGADLLICRGNGNLSLVGCGRFPDRDRPGLLFPDTMIGVPVDLSRVTKAYIEFAWNAAGVRRQLEKKARTTNGTHKVNQAVLRSIEIQLPPFNVQQQFESFADRLKEMQSRLRSGQADDLFHSLVQRAFRGDL